MYKNQKLKSILNIEKAPLIKPSESEQRKKLGIINEQKRKNKTFRMRYTVIEALERATMAASKKTNLDILPIHLIESVILYVDKHPSLLFKILKA